MISEILNTNFVLIMEDIELLRKYLSKMIQHLGYEVIESSDGFDAIKKVAALDRKCILSIAILDLNVKKGLGGIETAKILKKIYPDIKIVLTSGSLDLDKIHSKLDIKVDSYLTKPFNLEKLTSIIEKLNSKQEFNVKENEKLEKTSQKCEKFFVKCPLNLEHICDEKGCYIEKCFNLVNTGVALFKKDPCNLFFVNNSGINMAGGIIDSLLERIKKSLCFLVENPQNIGIVNKVQVENHIFGFSFYKFLDNFFLVVFKDITGIEMTRKFDNYRLVFSNFNIIISEIVHEVGNAIAGIMALLEVSLLNFDSYSKQEVKEKLVSAIEEIKKLKTLLMVLRPLGADSHSKWVQINLKEVIMELMKSMLSDFPELSYDFVNFPDECKILVRKDDFLKVLREIVSNTAFFTKGKGKIIFEYNKQNNYYEIVIKDNGPGIPEELIEKVFYPFFTTVEGKKGVGLTIARKRMLNMGGMLFSKPSKIGACFVVVIPKNFIV